MTHDEIEQYLKGRDLNTFEYQLAMDAILFAEQKQLKGLINGLKTDITLQKVLEF